jgi:DTW domain-containing protein YfiP
MKTRTADRMKFTLLTHTREFEKPSNTGKLVKEILGDAAEQVRWDRMQPPARLVEEIDAGGVALIYPGAADEAAGDLTGIRQVILIDGTWQEARRIHQRSPYLRNARRVSLRSAGKSQYNLRKNQKAAGLCTAECVVEILRSIGRDEDAERLMSRFLAFIARSGAKVAQPVSFAKAWAAEGAAETPGQ